MYELKQRKEHFTSLKMKNIKRYPQWTQGNLRAKTGVLQRLRVHFDILPLHTLAFVLQKVLNIAWTNYVSSSPSRTPNC